jgi:hypothetical protein
MSFLLRKLSQRKIWRRVFLERLCEPLHLNLLSVPVVLFGSFRAKVAFDLVLRHHHAFGLLKAADWAKQIGIDRVSALEFGVASGTGLINMSRVAKKVTRETGVEFEIVGFDTGTGMPAPQDYRDHPEYYHTGDFAAHDYALLREATHAGMFVGNVRDTLQHYAAANNAPIGFISLDVDYFSSSVDALQILVAENPARFLPWVVLYLDDVEKEGHNPFCGELAAIENFNTKQSHRKICKFNFLRSTRIFQRPPWIDHMYVAHIFDHPHRTDQLKKRGTARMDNPYLDE